MMEITEGREIEECADFQFDLEWSESGSDGSRDFILRGIHKGIVVGFGVHLPGTWAAGSLEIRSVGKESDAFIEILSELYEVDFSANVMAGTTPFTFLPLGGNPYQAEKGPVALKLFYIPDGKEEDREENDDEKGPTYAELYLNLDLASRRAEFKEKDEGYRSDILLALSGQDRPLPEASSTLSMSTGEATAGWTLTGERFGALPLPAGILFSEFFKRLNSKDNSFLILESSSGDYIQSGGTAERCTVEFRRINPPHSSDEYEHYAVGRENGSRGSAEIQMSGGVVRAYENEALDGTEAAKLFAQFYSGLPMLEGYVARRVRF